MRVVIAGGTGFIGKALCRELLIAGHEVMVLTRDPSRATARVPQGAGVTRWSPEQPEGLPQVLSDADAVVNLSGEGIAARRWTPEFKQRLVDSRVNSTRALVQAIQQAEPRPRVLVNASAVGIYGDRGEEELTEASPAGAGFLPDLAVRWEQAAEEARKVDVRVVKLRIGIVLGEEGGALQKMLLPFRFFVGGPFGSGQQWFPWIHLDDVTGITLHTLQSEAVDGTVNVVAPGIVRSGEFCKALGKVIKRPCWLPVPGFVLRLVAGELGETLLWSQRVIPQRATQMGYTFRYPQVEEALRAVLGAYA
ncbi:MAG: TIGR01777 family oxidoreductase [Armatimonadota bacterium]|nr:TIGR01777 family oxidoreductase [bacterium]MDW8320550.1 TIGR01777 family oxidoreductase [Armatimonadota bacterium]